MGNNAISQLQEGAGPTQSLALQGLARTHSACASIAMSVIVSFHFKKRKRKKIFMLIHGPMLHPADILIGLLVLPCNARTVIQGSIYGEKRVCNYSLLFSTKEQKNHSLVRAVAQPTIVSEVVLPTITKKIPKMCS